MVWKDGFEQLAHIVHTPINGHQTDLLDFSMYSNNKVIILRRKFVLDLSLANKKQIDNFHNGGAKIAQISLN